MKGRRGGVRYLSVFADGMKVLFKLDKKSLRSWKVQDDAWESLSLEGHTDVVYRVSTSTKGTYSKSEIMENTLQILQERDRLCSSTVQEVHRMWKYVFH